jgi:mycothione reductase
MERFDVLVIGSGSGMIVASSAVAQGFKTALVEHGKMGGTCINVGCVPSKILIYPADVIAAFKKAEKIGINGTINSVDFTNIITRMRTLINHDSDNQARAVENTPNLKWFKETGEFISDYTMKIGPTTVFAKMIFIVSGARIEVPLINGIEEVSYLTSDSVLDLKTQPKSILIIGGGYIGMEYAHFFSSIGTKTTVIQRPYSILPNEEQEISDLLKLEMGQRVEIHTGYEAIEVMQDGEMKTLVAKNRQDGSKKEFSAEAIMISTGRVPNSAILKAEKTSVEIGEQGFIKVNDYLETSKKNIWAFGDAIGKKMFKHVANYEASIAWHNAIHNHKVKVEYLTAPHAVFTNPQVASVGLKEEEAKKQKYKILVGKAIYKETAMGAAMGYPDGFVKVIVEQETGKILGAHIVGPEASILIQEITNAMVSEKGDFAPIVRGMHIHPALNEVVQNAFGSLRPG